MQSMRPERAFVVAWNFDESESRSMDESINLLNKWQSGDESAAAEIFDRYASRLLALAGSRLSAVMNRRVEADDVVQSVYRSFFRHAADGRYSVENNGQLWGLLAAITINKVRSQVKFHGAAKRNVDAEASMASSQSCYGLSPVDIARDPDGQDAAVLLEEYQAVIKDLTDLQRDVLELYLQNCSTEDIASNIRRSARTVRRALEDIREQLEKRLLH